MHLFNPLSAMISLITFGAAGTTQVHAKVNGDQAYPFGKLYKKLEMPHKYTGYKLQRREESDLLMISYNVETGMLLKSMMVMKIWPVKRTQALSFLDRCS